MLVGWEIFPDFLSPISLVLVAHNVILPESRNQFRRLFLELSSNYKRKLESGLFPAQKSL